MWTLKGIKNCKYFLYFILNLIFFLGIKFYASAFEDYTKLRSYVHENVRYGCAKCKKTYQRKESLGRHLRFDCGQNPSFACQICSKKFKHGYILLNHMRHTHNIFIEKLRQRHPKISELNSEINKFLPDWQKNDKLQMEDYLNFSQDD